MMCRDDIEVKKEMQNKLFIFTKKSRKINKKKVLSIHMVTT